MPKYASVNLHALLSEIFNRTRMKWNWRSRRLLILQLEVLRFLVHRDHIRFLIEDAPPSEAFPAHIDLAEPVAPDAHWLTAQN